MYSWRGLVNLYGVGEVDESVQDQSNTKFVSYPVIGSGRWIHQSLLSSIPLVFCAFTTSQSIHVARWKHSLVCIELVVLLRIPRLLLFIHFDVLVLILLPSVFLEIIAGNQSQYTQHQCIFPCYVLPNGHKWTFIEFSEYSLGRRSL